MNEPVLPYLELGRLAGERFREREELYDLIETSRSLRRALTVNSPRVKEIAHDMQQKLRVAAPGGEFVLAAVLTDGSD